MAEIKIEKKKPIWPWIILAIVLVAIIYFIYAYGDNDDYSDDANTDDVENIDSISDSDSTSWDTNTTAYDDSYATRDLTEVMRDSSRIGTDSTFTNRALYNLAERTLNIAKNHNIGSSSAVNDLEQYTMKNGNSGTQTAQHSKASNSSQKFKTVSNNIVKVIESLEANHVTRMQQKMEALKSSASHINGGTDLSKQQNALQTFFRKAHELLNNLNS